MRHVLRRALPTLLLVAAAPGLPAAVVVEETASGAAEQLRPGDVLEAWQRGGAAGRIGGPFDLLDVAVEEAPRGAVTLVGRRGGAPFEVEVALESARVRARPELVPAALAAIATVLESARHGDLEAATVEAAAAALDPVDGAWLALRASQLLVEARAPGRAAEIAAAAARRAEGRLPPHHVAHLWDQAGEAYLAADQPVPGGDAHREALRRRATRPLAAARSHNALGRVAGALGDHPASEAAFRRAVELRAAEAPGSLSEAVSRNNLAVALWQQDELRAAGDELERALAIKRTLDPGSSSEAASLTNLGLLARRRGDLARAEAFYREALALRERLEPGTMALGRVLTNLGVLLADRGQAEEAEELLRRALEITRRVRPGGPDEATDLGNLAMVAYDRGDAAEAERLMRVQLALLEAMDPVHPGEVARCLANLAELAVLTGRLDEAEAHLGRALPLARAQGETVHLAHALECRGDLELARGRADAAEAAFTEALAIVRRGAAVSLPEVRLRAGLAEVARRRGDLAGERERLEGAVEALEAQLARLGGTQDVRSGFRADRTGLYQRLQEVLVELGEPEAAFAVRERARARWLLELLAERDLVLGTGEDGELDRERAGLARERDRLVARLADAEGTDAAALRERLAALDRRRAELREEMRRRAPGLAAVREPEPLGAAAARALLAPGQTALAYSVGPERTLLYVLERGRPVAAHDLGVGGDELRRRVEWLRALVDGGAAGDGAALGAGAAELYRLLVAPAQAAVERSTRLLLLPDGPLQVLPFALLERPDDGVLLLEQRPLSTVASFTVLAELRRRAHPAASGRVVLADPRHPGAAARAAGGERAAMAPLPAARGEAAAVAAGARPATVLLGERASERAAKAVRGPLQALHLAAHVEVDERLPLSSAVLLAADPPGVAGGENGRLEAWEVLESVRLDAELVALSGCSSALGPERPGEGLLGLVRAFQFAGARTVLASLWRVEDAAAARVMRSFYRHLDDGAAPDEALRAAQLEALRGGLLDRLGEAVGLGPARPHPSTWAAFVLDGDASRRR